MGWPSKSHLNPALYAFWRGDFIHVGRGIGTVPHQIVARVRGVFLGFSGLYPGVILVLVVVSALVLLRRRPALGVTLVAPLGLAVFLAFSHVAPVGTGRTDIYLYPVLALLIATGLDEVIHLLPRRVDRPLALTALFVACVMLLTSHYGLKPSSGRRREAPRAPSRT